MRKVLVLLVAAFFAALNPVHAQAPATTAPKDAAKATSAADKAELARYAQLMQARDAIKAGRGADALPILDKVLADYEVSFPRGDKRLYVARDPKEALAYMLSAAADNKSASALTVWWGEALYMKGFVLVDLGRKDEAKAQFERLVELSPYHSEGLSELGNLYQGERNWPKALDYFERAQEATAYSPDAQQTSDGTRALRGQGFVLVELHRIDEAETKYRKCLEMDPNDAKAKNELEYIRQLRAKSK
jgi:tetratricopeptide (TPR) repeat protein